MREVRRASCPVMVGRTDEVARTRAAILAARDSGSVVVILGDAGIGKSRVSSEAARLAEAEGAALLLGYCGERASAAYAPVVSALNSYLHSANSAEVQRLFSGAARLAGTLVPDVAQAPDTPTTSEHIAAEHLFAALWHVFRRLGDRKPTLLLIEDAHWADQDTVDLLMYLAREAPELGLCMMLTARPEELRSGHPLVPALSALRRLGWLTEVPLQPLRRDGVEQMLTAMLNTAVTPALVDAMVERSGGVPYFIEELCASLDAPSLDSDPPTAAAVPLASEVPLSLRDALMSRLKSFGREDLRVLQVAAVSGERIDRRLLASATATDLDHVDQIADAAVRHHVLVEVIEGDTPRHYFRHALMRETLIAELPAREVRGAHRRLARALRDRHADTAAIAAELSRHYQEADEPAEALPFALEAARQASGLFAPAETLVQYQTALRLAAQVGADELPILLDAADAAIKTPGSQVEEGLALARRARSLARERRAHTDEARALNLISIQVWKDGHMDDAIRMSEEALALVAGRDDAAEADAIAILVMWLAHSGRREKVPALIARGSGLAAASGNMRALADLQQCSGLCADDPVAAEEAFTSSIRAARTAGSIQHEVDTLSVASMTALLHGRLNRARDANERALALVGADGDGAPLILMKLAHVEALLGDLGGALDRVTSLSPESLERTSAQTRTSALRALTEVYLRRGSIQSALEVADAALRLADETHTELQLSRAEYVRVHVALDDDAADGCIEPFLAGVWPPMWLVSPDVARHIARRDTALDRFADRVEAWTEARAQTMSRGPAALAARDFCHGLLALQHGDAESAITSLEASARRFAELPIPARQVESLIALAQANVTAGQRRRAVTTLLEARQIARAITASALEGEVAAAMRELGARMPREIEAGTQPGGLSEKEAVVAALIAAGSNNAEIAERLVVSPRTVANHVSNILAKLELHNRAEVARWAMAHGLTATSRRAAPPSGEPQRLTVLRMAGGGRRR